MKIRDVRRYETQVKEDCYQAYDRDYDGDEHYDGVPMCLQM